MVGSKRRYRAIVMAMSQQHCSVGGNACLHVFKASKNTGGNGISVSCDGMNWKGSVAGPEVTALAPGPGLAARLTSENISCRMPRTPPAGALRMGIALRKSAMAPNICTLAVPVDSLLPLP